MKELEKNLKEKEAEILQLRQQISSQESSIAQRGINLPEKTIHLSTLTSLIEQLSKAEDEQQQHALNLTLCKREADYHKKQAEELRSKVSTLVTFYIIFYYKIIYCILSFTIHNFLWYHTGCIGMEIVIIHDLNIFR